jgi:tungstate transport system substrate-binding protein
VVNPDIHDHDINAEGAQAFRAFLISPETQQLIAEYGMDRFGQPLFVPYAE